MDSCRCVCLCSFKELGSPSQEVEEGRGSGPWKALVSWGWGGKRNLLRR